MENLHKRRQNCVLQNLKIRKRKAQPIESFEIQLDIWSSIEVVSKRLAEMSFRVRVCVCVCAKELIIRHLHTLTAGQ